MKRNVLGKLLLLVLLSMTISLMLGCTQTEPRTCGDDQTLIDGECVDNDIQDTTPPVITGTHNFNYVTNEAIPDYMDGVTASDDVDGDLTAELTLDTSEVDYTTEGTYDIHYTVDDEAGNTTTETVTITITIYIPDYAALLAEDMAALDIPTEVEGVMELTYLDLLTAGENGTIYTWTSSHPDVIDTDGLVFNPLMNEEAITVHLSVQAVNDDETDHDEFDVIVHPYDEVEVTSTANLPFTNCEVQMDIGFVRNVKVFYVDDGDVPYVDFSTIVGVIDNAISIDQEDIVAVGEDKLSVSYDPVLTNLYFFNGVGAYEPDPTYEQTMTIDFTNNTVTVSSYQFFSMMAVGPTMWDTGTLEITDAYFDEGHEVTIPFGDFNIDFITHQIQDVTHYLMPLHVVSFLLTYEGYYRIYYDGEGLSGGGAECLAEFPEAVVSPLNGRDVPFDVRMMTYNLLTIVMEYFSANKFYNETESYYDLFDPLKKELFTKSTDAYYLTLNKMVTLIDDPHVHSTYRGYYSSDPLRNIAIVLSSDTPRRQAREQARNDIRLLLGEKYFSLAERPTVRMVDNDKTAILAIDSSYDGIYIDVQNRLDHLPVATENVVFDFLNHGGGSVTGIFELLGLLTDEPIVFDIYSYIDDSRVTYTVTVDEAAYDYNWYFVTSGSSYSAANITPMLARRNDIAPTFGAMSAGGATAVEMVFFPCGFIFGFPANHTFLYGDGDPQGDYTLTSYEFGFPVDIEMVDLMDDDEIVALIAQHQAENPD